jgi:hypothetical protein
MIFKISFKGKIRLIIYIENKTIIINLLLKRFLLSIL